MAKKVLVRVNPGLRGIDAARVKDTLITKKWTEVSPTLAKSLVGLEYNGRPKFEFEDGEPDESPPEDLIEDPIESE